MTSIEFKKKKMTLAINSKSGKARQITLSKSETFCINKFLNQNGKTNF